VDPITIGGRTIDLTSIELSLSKIEVEGDDDVKTEIRGTTVVVAVPTNGQLVTPITATLAAGIYTELELKVQTVRIRGTIDGSPFDVSVLVDDELETDIVPPLVVAQGTTANLTVSLDVSNWFRRPDGSAIDLAHLNATLQGQLRSNIVASFEAFEDDDHRGHDDD
jgi:hypothetical protein